MSAHNVSTPRSVLLPAVLQREASAPCFGTIASLSDQGLAFDIQTTPLDQHTVGDTAQLDFELHGQHFSCKSLIVHIQDQRVLLSLRDASAPVLAALQSVNRKNLPSLASRLSTQQVQQSCHACFMDGMKAVVVDFYRLLPEQIAEDPASPKPGALETALLSLRPQLVRHFTQTYPMYPELQTRPADAAAGEAADPADMARVDDWICRTTIAQQVEEFAQPLPNEFSHHYNSLLHGARKHATHPYQPDTVLYTLTDLIAPLRLGPNERILCYEVMGRALQKHAIALYQDLLNIVGDAPSEHFHASQHITSLDEWLKMSALASSGDAEGASTGAASTQINELAAMLSRLTDNLGELNERLPASGSPASGAYIHTNTLIPGLLARDRIFSRFLPAAPSLAEADDPLQGSLELFEPGTNTGAVGQVLGGLSDLDEAALHGLYALMRQLPTLESGPEKLSAASQVRALMLQAQGLLLEYTLNGLTYQTQPDHPAWTLINALDALHQGADNRGQFLDPALHHAISLAMQWLLGQEDVDAALKQVNSLLEKINRQLHEARQQLRDQHLQKLGPLVSDPALINTPWCVVKRDEEAIPYEVLGKHGNTWMLLDRSATSLLEIPAERFRQEVDSGLIQESDDFDEPVLERIAEATLTASLDAVHAYTWQDPASGCLKRSALMDQLERLLAHPVTEPATFCALIEIPTMRPCLSSLPGDELAVMQKRTGELLLEVLDDGEHCGRLSDVSFLMVFSPQAPDRLQSRLSRLKADLENLHPEWKMIGAVVPLVEDDTTPTSSSMLRRANMACAPQRQHAQFDLSTLSKVLPPTNQIDPLPFSSLYLRCQKIASCRDSGTSHYEVLLGVSEALVPRHTTQSFVVMAEQSGLIYDLDMWVLRSVLDWMDRYPDQLAQLSGLSVNLSGNSLTQSDHVGAIVSLLSTRPHLTQKLIFEVTETAAINNLDVAVRSLHALRTLGCRIALDDFGSGYSSYGYLRSLPLDYLKIDGTYIRNILSDKTDQALTASMVDVAHALGLKVIAEYVDSEAVHDWLKDLGVDYVQGYWVHQPERLDGLVLH